MRHDQEPARPDPSPSLLAVNMGNDLNQNDELTQRPPGLGDVTSILTILTTAGCMFGSVLGGFLNTRFPIFVPLLIGST